MPDLVTALADNTPPAAQLRTGRVVQILGASQLVIDVGGGQLVNAPALTQYDPILGDIVQLLQQGPVLLALGRPSPVAGDNVLINPSFELDAVGVPPTSWTSVVHTGAATTRVNPAAGWGAVTGSNWLEVHSTSAPDTTVYTVSEPIAVTEGQRWTAAAWTVNQSWGVNGGFSELLLSWYADSTTMYPSGLGDYTIQGLTFPVGGVPGWSLLRELSGSGVSVPAGVRFMRVVLSTTLAGGTTTVGYWDGIICRRLAG